MSYIEKINSNTFVCQLSEEKQNAIKNLVIEHLKNEGYEDDKISEIITSVMENRVWNIEEIVDIKQFLL